MEKSGYVYILASGFQHLYVGVTSNLERRVAQHKEGTYAGAFTERYNIKQLVYIERFGEMATAIAREKQLKRWSRVKKIGLIVAVNPDWQDLSVASGTPVEAFSGEPGRIVLLRAKIQRSLHCASRRAVMLGRDDAFV